MVFKKRFFLVIALVLLPVMAMFFVSCAKKPIVKEEPKVVQEPAPVPQEVVKPVEKDAQAEQSTEIAKIDEEVLKSDRKKQIESNLQDIFFDYDRYDITDQAVKKIEANLAVLKSNSDITIIVGGHCDERGTPEYNLVLGEKRASAVKNYLVSLGADAGKIEIISYGEDKPFDPGHSEISWAKNRRAHLIVK